jgi:fatty acid desaturase
MSTENKYDMSKLWILHGKAYDFGPFVNSHPGGASYILVGRGRDCTELFESQHSLSKANMDPLFKKYEVSDVPKEDIAKVACPKKFDWSEKSEFWHALKNDVTDYFEQSKQSIKADSTYWLALWTSVFAQLWLLIQWYRHPYSLLFPTLYGMIFGINGFFMMHTASHGGLSKRGWVNWLGTAVYANLLGWFHYVWMQHHVYGHHSYTGVEGSDPDMHNINFIARKSFETKFKPQYQFQDYSEILFLFMPNQWFGQIIVYVRSIFNGNLFNITKITHDYTFLDNLFTTTFSLLSFTLFALVPIYLHGLMGLAQVLCFATATGVMYWAIVFPNHDVDEVHLNRIETDDWGKQQVVHSSNFYLPQVLSMYFGGMNYQIEHHLFPGVHPRHYPAISEIVQSNCKKYDVPYVSHSSWFHSLASHFKFMSRFAAESS